MYISEYHLEFFILLLFFLPHHTFSQNKEIYDPPDRIHRVQIENQHNPDLGNGKYRNPILLGHYHDPSVVRVEGDYYMTHCELDGLLIWHSRDLVNWRPIGKALKMDMGDIWAPELIYYNELFYLYIPVRLTDPSVDQLEFSNYVLTSEDPAGPWSDPIDLKIGGIDPGHIADDQGNRYLYVNQGRVVPLSKDGLKVTGEMKQVYEGWEYPEEWIDECMCLESPKLFFHNNYYYMVSAQGGTAGPSTSHMVVVARSNSPLGPWENSPYNPILRTEKRSEAWWSQGHGTILDARDGTWWMLYHAFQNNLRTMGRNTCMLPIEWTDDNWPVVKKGIHPSDAIIKPAGENVGHGMPISDDFTNEEIGPHWYGFDRGNSGGMLDCGNGRLIMKASGTDPRSATKILCMPANVSYETEVEVELSDSVEAGLLIWSDKNRITGIAAKNGEVFAYTRSRIRRPQNFTGSEIKLKVININHDCAIYFADKSNVWKKIPWGLEVSHSRIPLRIALFAAGNGNVIFRNFKYKGIR